MKFTPSKLGLWALGLAAFFGMLTLIFPRLELLAILNGIFLGVVVSAIIVYTPLIVAVAHKAKLDRVSQLSLGVGLLFGSIGASKLYWIIWQAVGAPESWRSNYFICAIAFVSIIGGCLFVTAPGYPPPSSTEEVLLWGGNRKLLLTFGFLGGLATFILTMLTTKEGV